MGPAIMKRHAILSKISETKDPRSINTVLPWWLFNDVALLAETTGVSMAEMIRQLLNEALKARKRDTQ